MEKERLVIRMKPELKEQFKKATKKTGFSMTSEVKRFIKDYIKENEE